MSNTNTDTLKRFTHKPSDAQDAIARENERAFIEKQIAKASKPEALLVAADHARTLAANGRGEKREEAKAAANVIDALARMPEAQRVRTLRESWADLHPVARSLLTDAASKNANAAHRAERAREHVRVLDGGPSLVRDGDALVDEHGNVRARLVGDAAVEVRLAERVHAMAQRMAGRRLMADLSPDDVHPYVATMGAAMIPSVDLAAEIVAPVTIVKQRGKGTWYGQSSADAIALVAPRGDEAGGAVPEVHPNFNAVSYATAPRALAAYVPRELAANADFDLLSVAAQRLAEAVALDWESRVAALLTTSANWNGGNVVTCVAGTKWNGGASADPLSNIFAVMAASTLPVNAIVMSEGTARYFFAAPGVRDYVQAGGQLPRILIAKARTKAAGVPSYVWGGDVALVRVPGGDADLATARSFTWSGGQLDGADPEGVIRSAGRGWGVRLAEIGDRGARGGQMLIVARDDAAVMLDGTIGGLIKSAVQ